MLFLLFNQKFHNCEHEFHNYELFENRFHKYELIFNGKWGFAKGSIFVNSPLPVNISDYTEVHTEDEPGNTEVGSKIPNYTEVGASIADYTVVGANIPDYTKEGNTIHGYLVVGANILDYREVRKNTLVHNWLS